MRPGWFRGFKPATLGPGPPCCQLPVRSRSIVLSSLAGWVPCGWGAGGLVAHSLPGYPPSKWADGTMERSTKTPAYLLGADGPPAAKSVQGRGRNCVRVARPLLAKPLLPPRPPSWLDTSLQALRPAVRSPALPVGGGLAVQTGRTGARSPLAVAGSARSPAAGRCPRSSAGHPGPERGCWLGWNPLRPPGRSDSMTETLQKTGRSCWGSIGRWQTTLDPGRPAAFDVQADVSVSEEDLVPKARTVGPSSPLTPCVAHQALTP